MSAAEQGEIMSLKLNLQSLQTEFHLYKQNTADMISRLELNIADNVIGDHDRDDLQRMSEEVKNYVDQEASRFVTRFLAIENRLGNLEQQKHYDPDTTLIATGITYSDNENVQDKAKYLIDALGLDIPVVRAKRLTPRGRHPGLVKIELQSLDHKLQVLRNKNKLSNHNIYRKVYLRSSKSHSDRLIEINANTLIEELGLGHLRVAANGRIIPRTPHDFYGGNTGGYRGPARPTNDGAYDAPRRGQRGGYPPRPQRDEPRPQHQRDQPHQHQRDVPRPQYQRDEPRPQHQRDMPRPQYQRDMPRPRHQRDEPGPQHHRDEPRPQHQHDDRPTPTQHDRPNNHQPPAAQQHPPTRVRLSSVSSSSDSDN